MSTDSKMNSANNLSVIHPDNTEHPTTPVQNMPFDESLEFRNSDYMSSEAMEISDEMEECQRLEREDIDVYDEVFNSLPPIPPAKDEEDDDSIDTLEECSRLERERDDAYGRAFQNKILKEYPELYKNMAPIPPVKEEEEGILDEIEEKTYNGVYYPDSMDMEAAMREDANKIKTRHINLGDGEFKYIKNLHEREMLTNAWQAITQTNTWNFMGQEIESFMLSSDPRIYEISRKMEELGYSGHSGCSFGCTMRNIQYLAQKGEEEFKKLFQLDQLESSI